MSLGSLLYLAALGVYLGYILHDQVADFFARLHAVERAVIDGPRPRVIDA